MAYKRNIDRLPIIPAGAKEHNVTCHYCIVGCGYKAYTWPLKKQGTHRQQLDRAKTCPSSRAPKPKLGMRRRCITSSSRTAPTCIW